MAKATSKQFRARRRGLLWPRGASGLKMKYVHAAQMREAIGTFIDSDLATLLDESDLARLVVLRSGEIFRIDDESITRLV